MSKSSSHLIAHLIIMTEYISVDIDPFYIGSNASAMSGDGQILVTANETDVIVSDVASQKIIHTIEGDGETITNLNITPDGSRIAVISQSQQLRIIDTETGNTVKTFKMSSPVYVSASEGTSSLFAFGGTDGTITVWDIGGGYVTHSLTGHGATISTITFYGSLNQKDWKLASGDTHGVVKIWDLIKRKAIHTYKEHNSAVRGVSFYESYFLSGGRDEVVMVYKDFKPFKTLLVNQQVEVCRFLDTEKLWFYTAGSDNLFKVFDLEGNMIICSTSYKTEEELVIIDVLPVLDMSYYLVCSDQSLVKISLDFDNQKVDVLGRIAGNHGIIADIKYVGENFDFVALATNSPGLRIVDVKRPMDLILCEGHTDILNVVDVTIDGKWLATGSKDSDVRLWKFDTETTMFKPYAIFKGHIGSITALGLPRTPQEFPKFIISCSTDLTIKKWKVPLPKTVDENPIIVKSSEYTRRAHDKEVNSIDVSPNDEFIGTASFDKLGKIWDLHTGETIGILKGHRRGLWDIKFSKYEKKVITSSGDKTLKLWSLNDYQIEQSFEGHTNSVQKIQFINKGQQIISGGADGLIKIWEAKTGECLKTYDNHSNRIWSIDVKYDGKEFVSSDANGQISFWYDNSESVIKIQEAETKLKVENDQKLTNLMSHQDYTNAFLLALELNYSMKLFSILDEIFKLQKQDELVDILKLLNESQMIKLFEKLTNWNINFKNFEVSQNVINLILNNINIDKLMVPKLVALIDKLTPYNERHFKRLETLIEQSYLLDFTIEQM